MSGFDITRLKENLHMEKSMIEEHILRGGCSDFAAYRQKVGERQGILIAFDKIKETIKQMGDDDE